MPSELALRLGRGHRGHQRLVDGPGGQRPVGSGVLTLSQLESAIKSVQ